MQNAVNADMVGKETRQLVLEAKMPARKREEEDSGDPREARRIKIEGVLKLVPLHRNTINRLVKSKKFPQPTRPNGTVRFWSEAEVLAWCENNVSGGASWPRGPRHRQWNRK
jgi:predicted DNA-binding transcriptional regulator AlpA